METLRKRYVAIVLLTLTAIVVRAQMSPPEQVALEAYRKALASAESSARPSGLENVVNALTTVREALMRTRDGTTVLESLSDAEFTRVKQVLQGVLVSRDEVVLVELDPQYFLKVAREHGDSADQQFFAALTATYRTAGWPVYVEQLTDINGCTAFGSGKIVKTYQAWTEFRKAFPKRYVAPAESEIERVTQALTASTCACGDAGSVEREMRQFVEGFPAAPASAVVNIRLRALRAGRSDIKVECTAP